MALRRAGEIGRPVELARTLTRYGLSLRKAHDVLRRLTEDEAVHVELRADDRPGLVADLAGLGVAARPLQRPEASVAEIRKRFGLSQAEFAVRFGLDQDTVQNWEQGRYQPDRVAQLLLRVIERHPDIVEDVLAAAEDAPAGALPRRLPSR